MRVGELAKPTGTTPRTVRHYHQIGLLPVPTVVHGQREYTLAHVARMTRIRWLVRAGVPLTLGSQLTGDVRSAYLRYTATIIAIVVSVFAVQSVLVARREETSGLTDVVLTAGRRRWAPLVGRFVATAGATLTVLLVTATLTAVSAMRFLGGTDMGKRAFVYVVGQWLPVAAVAGCSALIVGLLPRLTGLA